MKPIYALLALLSLLSNKPAYCQQHAPDEDDEDIHARLITGRKRSLIAYAGKDHSFTMEVNAREKEVLTQYMNYELGYYRKKLRQNYNKLQTEWVTIRGRLFLVWYFDMPKDYKLVSTQLYFSTLYAGQVLDLNAPVFKSAQFSHARAVLTRLANSLKTFDKTLDMGSLKRQVNR